nr:hypothetical protein [Tanacetum cinerariifolium]
MDLCGPMKVESINGKKYIIVIVDDYSRYSWVYFLCTKDEAPYMIINFINQVQRKLKAHILKIRTNNGTEFRNEKLQSFYTKVGIVYHTLMDRMPQQNGVVERRNRTVVEAASTMLIFLKTPEFIWAEAIATAFFTYNCSIVHTRYNKTPYELIHRRKSYVQYFHVFGSLCYPTNDRDKLGKMKPKADFGIFIGYSKSSRGFCIYNHQTKKIMETIHVKFDELTAMASKCNNSGPGLNCLNFQDSLEELKEILLQQDLDNLFGPLYEEYYVPSTFEVSNNFAPNTLDNEDTPSPSLIIVEDSDDSHIVTSSDEPITQESSTPVLETHSDKQIQEDDSSNMHEFHQQHQYTDKWTKNHPIEQVIAMLDHSWIESVQDELNKFKRLDVWELVPLPDGKHAMKKALYGLKQDPRACYDKLSSFLSEQHFTK